MWKESIDSGADGGSVDAPRDSVGIDWAPPDAAWSSDLAAAPAT
jgi:hypothetical protein